MWEGDIQGALNHYVPLQAEGLPVVTSASGHSDCWEL